VCGSNVISSIESFMTLSNMGFLSPDGKCYSFDSRGNGYARGEGFGVLVVKLLADAIRDGDMIRAVVRSSGTNQNGRNRSITQTSKADQVSLIKHVYEKAGLDLNATRFVEAHGTGTALGDPTEASAIGEVFGRNLDADSSVYV
jgi:acyl transferase domain-containing protein